MSHTQERRAQRDRVVVAVQIRFDDGVRDFVAARGGRVWAWVDYGKIRKCCAPGFMHASCTLPATGCEGFMVVASGDGVEVMVRGMRRHAPAVLSLAVAGRHRDRLDAYWDGSRLVG